MTPSTERARTMRRAAITLLVAAALYEAVAQSGLFPAVLLPTLPKIVGTLFALTEDGTMLWHAFYTLARVMLGFALAVAAGVLLGILMARSRAVENFVMPLASALMPIPSLAWVPLFILWFGLGDTVTILIVFYAAMFPTLLNTWTGVRAVNPLWLRAAGAMGANESALFWKGDHSGRIAFDHHRPAPGIPARMDRSGGRRNAGGVGLGIGLGHLRRQGIPQRGHHDGIAGRDRRYRLRVRTAGLRVAGTRHRAAVGTGAGREGLTLETTMSDIEIRDVSLVYDTPSGPVRAIDNASFRMAASEFLCIVGPSGCGKSTLLNIIAGFLPPTSGEIRIGGKPVTGHGMDRGVVFQDFAQLFPWRTALGNVTFGLEMKGVGREEREKIAMEQLALVKLNPAVLPMDEPFAALDALTRDAMQRLLAEVWRETRKTVVYVTHNVAEAVYLADRVVVMTPHPGRVKIEIPISLARPRDPLSVAFLHCQKDLLRQLGDAPDEAEGCMDSATPL